MNSATINKPTSSSSSTIGSGRQARPSSLPKGRTIPKPSVNSNNAQSIARKPRPSSASVSRGGNTTTLNNAVEKKPATIVKEGPVTRTSFETGSQVKEELREKAKLSIRNQRLTERYYLTSLQLLKRVNAGACKDNKERKVAMDRLKLMEDLHLQSIETTDLSLLASEENLKKMHKNKYPNIQPKIYEASKNYGAGAEKEREREERERLNQTTAKQPVEQQPEIEKPKRTLRGRAAPSTTNTTTTAPTTSDNRSPTPENESADSSSDSDSDESSEKPKVYNRPSATLYRPPPNSSTTQTTQTDEKPKRTLRGGETNDSRRKSITNRKQSNTRKYTNRNNYRRNSTN
ncbi:predicted protein [Naegleria gruberi]|uniref:Predicted protein n=1 Tax=Naegleria gruberi TaxID=5762 RepID=D2VQ34_NAEGR|nr:uncharacterized protein NAEGRDRAFT_71147 [Naegleria gruberi]EFC41112.1 predicted protein [Naegleria gruberi]|eukprot:XP_002673856.1 predicted protein [Naegleria gruberi strain NEG-M]